MVDHVQWSAALTNLAERAGGYLSGMKGLVDFFANEALNISKYKPLTVDEILVVTSYTREAYLEVSILPSY